MPKTADGKISDTLMRRLQLQNGLRRLADEPLGVESWQSTAKQLADLLKQGIPFPWLIDIVNQSQHLQLTASLLSHLLISADDADLVEQVADYIGSPSIPDAARAEFLKVLFYYGYDLSDLSDELFDDPALMVQASVDSMLKQLEQEPDAVGYILEELQHLSPEDKLLYVGDLVTAKDGRCLSLLYHLALSDNKQIAHAAIRGLAALRNGRALGALQCLQLELSDDSLRDLLAREERRLKFLALEPENLTTSAPVRLEHTLVGPPDLNDQQAVWLIGSEDGSRVVVQIIIDLQEGVVDAYGVGSLSQEAYQQFLDDTRKRHSLLSGANNYALSLLQNALYISRAAETPLPEAYYYWLRRLQLGLEPISYIPEEIGDCRDLGLEAVIQMPIVRHWAIEHPLVTKLAAGLEQNLNNRTAFSHRLHDCFEQLAGKLVNPAKQRWVLRLQYAADFYLRSNDQEVAASLAHALHDLQISDTCLDITFFQALFLQSLLQAFGS